MRFGILAASSFFVPTFSFWNNALYAENTFFRRLITALSATVNWLRGWVEKCWKLCILQKIPLIEFNIFSILFRYLGAKTLKNEKKRPVLPQKAITEKYTPRFWCWKTHNGKVYFWKYKKRIIKLKWADDPLSLFNYFLFLRFAKRLSYAL